MHRVHGTIIVTAGPNRHAVSEVQALSSRPRGGPRTQRSKPLAGLMRNHARTALHSRRAFGGRVARCPGSYGYDGDTRTDASPPCRRKRDPDPDVANPGQPGQQIRRRAVLDSYHHRAIHPICAPSVDLDQNSGHNITTPLRGASDQCFLTQCGRFYGGAQAGKPARPLAGALAPSLVA